MRKTFAYIRASANHRDATQQRHEILAYGKREGIHIAAFIEDVPTAPKRSRQQRIDALVAALAPRDCLIVSKLSSLGRSTSEVIVLTHRLMDYGVTIIVIQQGLVLQQASPDIPAQAMVTLLALFAELEREYTSVRSKEALETKKAQGVPLGKPKGSIQASIYDKDRAQIEELLRLGVSQRRIISLHLGYGSPNSLSHYIRTRGLVVEPDAALRELRHVSKGKSIGSYNRTTNRISGTTSAR